MKVYSKAGEILDKPTSQYPKRLLYRKYIGVEIELSEEIKYCKAILKGNVRDRESLERRLRRAEEKLKNVQNLSTPKK